MKRSDILRDVKAALAHADAVQAYNQPKRNKYGNRKVTKIGRDGKSETFDSVKEYERHLVLLDMQKRHEIFDLERQVTFKLIVNGIVVGNVRPDWTYQEWYRSYGNHLHRRVAEDAKGYQTPDHKTRWKLAKALYPSIDWRLS